MIFLNSETIFSNTKNENRFTNAEKSGGSSHASRIATMATATAARGSMHSKMQEQAHPIRPSNLFVFILDRTRRAWVAPARDGRYVLGQLRSRTAGVSFLSFWDGVCRHSWNGPKIGKILF